MIRRNATSRLLGSALLALVVAGCSDQPELIDAGKDGGTAFIAFTLMVVVFTAFIFSLDKIRRNREERENR